MASSSKAGNGKKTKPGASKGASGKTGAAAAKPASAVPKARAKAKRPAAAATAAKKSAAARGTGAAKPARAAAKPAPVKKTRTVCLSHKEDLDGISAAALIKQAHGGDTVLTDYPGQMKMLADIASDMTLKRLYICDLGLSKKNQNEFIEIVTGLRKRRVSIAYIDHHAIDPGVARKLEDLGVRLVHDTGECASVLVYGTFKAKLGDHAKFVASCAAITDYMEDRPAASALLQTYDRQFALISATVMTYNITGRQKDDGHLLSLVDALAESKFPHEIPDSFESARTQVEKLSEMIAKVRAGLKKTKNLAHMEVTDAGAGGAVNFVLGMSGKDVGVAYKAKKDDDFYAVSVRGSKSCKFHLGKIVNLVADELGGSGGGHDRACGATIPLRNIKKFISELNRRIDA